MAQNEAVMTETEALPASLLYSLFNAFGPKALLKGGPRGDKFDKEARRTFEEVVRAAEKAKSAAEFAKLIGASAIQEDNVPQLPIVGLEVYPRGDAVLIRIKYANGVIYDHYYPTGNQ